MGPLGTVLVILGPKGAPKRHTEAQMSIFRHTEAQMSIFIDFRVDFGCSWDPLWARFCDFSVIWGGKMEDWFQVHVFSDPGMEIMLFS